MKTYEELLAERDALAVHNSELVSACKLAIDMFVANECNVPNTIETLQDAIDGNPQQCLAEIKADAVIEFAKEYGGKFSGLPDFASSAVSLFADQYASKIRNTGTWLKDSNVNGGKRQGGEK